MTGDIDVRLLRAFVTVADTGTVSRAADRLARTQAAVSMQLQRLEGEVGAELLHRSPRGVTLTEAGEILLAFARKAIAIGDDARRKIEGRRLVGRVRLGIVEDLAVTRLPLIIADFRRRHPSVEIELTSASSSDLSKSLGEGKCDIVMADPARFTMAPRGHLSRQLVWAASRMIEIDDEVELPLIIFEGACSWQDRMLASLAEAGIGWKIGCRVSTFATLISALRAGLGIGLLLQEGLPPDCQSLNGRFNLPPAPTADFGVYLARDPSRLVEECGDFLRAGFEA
ncbi:LysR family transcriptional regulator [Mesorhizobium sp. M0174]|uniref:LysR family transcriptional regulator n=1 Tax=Mesorhizobium sp. M0174 TaxID=2956904 RepID=UPI0033382C2D